MKTPLQKLKQWFDHEHANGLFDIKIFTTTEPKTNPNSQAAGILKVLKLWKADKGRVIQTDQDFLPAKRRP